MSETQFTPSFTEKDRTCRPRLFIMAGAPGCGKTTWARNFFKDYEIVSSDAIREEKWPGEPYDASRNEEVFDEFHHRLSEMLYKGMDAVADATSLSAMARAELQLVAVRENAETHLIFFKNWFTAVERNAEREGNAKVPWEAMEVMWDKFQDSLSAILEENYTSITTIEDTT